MSEKDYNAVVSNRCSISRVGINEKDIMCYDCKVVKEGTKYIKQLTNKLADQKETIKYLRAKAEFDMPDCMRGQFRNGGCTDRCDMVDGPCACGATHNAKEWIVKLVKIIIKLRDEAARKDE